jgi:toxin-antitoxin system PIN domain toxin
MVAVDANVLLYAVNRDDPNHPAARRWLERRLTGNDPVGFAWVVLLAFVRIATHPRVFPVPLTATEAIAVVEEWLSQPSAVVLTPTPRHLGILSGLLAPSGTGGNLVTDAHLAALALEHGAGIASFDRDFLRFPGVELIVPSPV